MVLTSSGVVLTNNHVIRNATAIRVVVPATGRSFTAKVVGYDASDDVAVLQAGGASNLKTIPLGDSATLNAGQSVKALGNAGGTGSLRAASGTVTGVDRAITVGDDQGGSESLTGMIETNAAVQPGDSGGPLMNAAGQVVGMDTAASAGNGFEQAATSDGYAIPINKALAIAVRIMRGNASAAIHIGGTAFLGVEVADEQLRRLGCGHHVGRARQPRGRCGPRSRRPDHIGRRSRGLVADRAHHDHHDPEAGRAPSPPPISIRTARPTTANLALASGPPR